MRAFRKLLLSAGMLLLILSSCDLFFIGPSLNLNWDDPNAGFGRLDAEQIGKDEIRVSWDWYDIERQLRGQAAVFDEIVIKYNKNSRPLSRFGGTSFEIKNWNPVSKPMWSAQFDGLEQDEEYYFALYAHEKDGRWMAPVYTSKRIEGYNIDSWSPGWTRAFGALMSTGNLDALNTISDDQVDIYYYEDVWEDDNIQEAILSFNITTGPTVDDKILIYPVRLFIDDSADPISPGIGIDEFTVDRSVRVEIPVETGFSGLKTVDMTNVFAKAHYHGTKGFLLMTQGEVIAYDTFNLQIDTVWNY